MRGAGRLARFFRRSSRPATSTPVGLPTISRADLKRVERATELVRQEAVLRLYGADPDPAYDPILDSLLDLLAEVRPNEVCAA